MNVEIVTAWGRAIPFLGIHKSKFLAVLINPFLSGIIAARDEESDINFAEKMTQTDLFLPNFLLVSHGLIICHTEQLLNHNSVIKKNFLQWSPTELAVSRKNNKNSKILIVLVQKRTNVGEYCTPSAFSVLGEWPRILFLFPLHFIKTLTYAIQINVIILVKKIKAHAGPRLHG